MATVAPVRPDPVAADGRPTVPVLEIKGRVVTVQCGSRMMEDCYVGHTVASVRADLASLLDIPTSATAIINGEPVATNEEAAVLIPAGRVEFVHPAGTKG